MSQHDLGTAIGLAPGAARSQISRWESGSRSPRIAHLYAVAEALDVEPSTLVPARRGGRRGPYAPDATGEPHERVGAAMRAARTAAGLTVSAASVAMGQPASRAGTAVSAWELGRTSPDLVHVVAFAEAVGANPRALFNSTRR